MYTMSTKAILIHKMETALQKLLQEVEKYTDHEFNTIIITGSWTVKEVLSHIAAWDIEAVNLSKKLLTHNQVQWPDFDTFNACAVSKRIKLTREEIIAEVKENRQAYIQFLQGLPDYQLDSHGVRNLAEQIVSHDYHHLHQIKDSLNEYH